MSQVPQPPSPHALLKDAGLFAKKSWGQNFLLDQNVLRDIAEATGCGPRTPIVELGAGLGALTYYLALRGGRVLAIERDREIAPILRSALSWANELTVREADAGRLDYGALAAELGGPFTVAGNLPYQLSSRILVSLAEAYPHVSGAVVLVQREVAERLAAEPGGRDFGLLTVLVQRVFTVERVREVPPGAFLPPPKVRSTVVRLRAHAEARSLAEDAALVATARAAFHSRRKTLKNSLAAGLGKDSHAVTEAITSAGLDPVARAETLSLADFRALAQRLKDASLL